ncbi:peroxisomal targeting signal 2 receptor [Mycoemilia scoparia]|uniref:Peroxin-7 n=1 Tax=Mycoemilia scoparia TaxID=417184 RepID=A0A9W8DU40_9FUNG|nr:peroxisomal targeting signal 2 receptor [Mycoemilia scoparia]
MIHQYRTQKFKGYSVKFSPFKPDLLACAGAANFGLVGNGRLTVLGFNPNAPELSPIRMYDTQDGLFDVCWSERHENQLVTGSGDGSIALWDITIPDYPVKKWREHSREIMGIEWNYVSKDTFLSASWDRTIKLWRPDAPQSLMTFAGHSGCVYTAAWCPHQNTTFASCSEDRTIKIWSLNNPQSPVGTIQGHSNQVLSLDWNKYIPNQIATTSSDKTIKVWDIRNPKHAVTVLGPFEFAMRRCKFSPHHPNIIAAGGYDMASSVWDLSKGRVVYLHDPHCEFVHGLDWSLFTPNVMTTCAWDEMVHVFNVPLPLQLK